MRRTLQGAARRASVSGKLGGRPTSNASSAEVLTGRRSCWACDFTHSARLRAARVTWLPLRLPKVPAHSKRAAHDTGEDRHDSRTRSSSASKLVPDTSGAQAPVIRESGGGGSRERGLRRARDERGGARPAAALRGGLRPALAGERSG